MKTATLIPARIASTRLPAKPLKMIGDKPMILHAYEAAKSANLGDVIVATTDQCIVDIIQKHGGTAIITDPDLPSGTDRIYAALNKMQHNYEYVINLQGDIPFMQNSSLHKMIENIRMDGITTLASLLEESRIHDTNAVKIAMHPIDHDYKALYFSRSAIPNGIKNYWHHIGVYGYPLHILEKFVKLPQGHLEARERLEQLRALENNIPIYVKTVADYPYSVDTAEDLAIAINNYAKRSNKI